MFTQFETIRDISLSVPAQILSLTCSASMSAIASLMTLAAFGAQSLIAASNMGTAILAALPITPMIRFCNMKCDSYLLNRSTASIGVTFSVVPSVLLCIYWLCVYELCWFVIWRINYIDSIIIHYWLKKWTMMTKDVTQIWWFRVLWILVRF